MNTLLTLCLSTIAFALFCVFVLPELCYAFACMDRHYFGYFHEPEPYYAKTTANQKYYSENNIPFKTSDDIRRDYEGVKHNKSLGLPAFYEIEHK